MDVELMDNGGFAFPNIQKPKAKKQITYKFSHKLGREILLLIWMGDIVFYLSGKDEINDFMTMASHAPDKQQDLFESLMHIIPKQYDMDDKIQGGTTVGDFLNSFE